MKERQAVRHTDGKLGLGRLQLKKPPHPGNKVCLSYRAEQEGRVSVYNWTWRRGYCIQPDREAGFFPADSQDLMVMVVSRRQD